MKFLFQFLKVLVLFGQELKTSILKVRKLKFRQFKILNFPPKISQIDSLKNNFNFLELKHRFWRWENWFMRTYTFTHMWLACVEASWVKQLNLSFLNLKNQSQITKNANSSSTVVIRPEFKFPAIIDIAFIQILTMMIWLTSMHTIS